MTNQVSVSIESQAKFRSGSTTSEQKEFGQYQEYRTLLAQILKVMVILASLVGAGVAIGWFWGLFEPHEAPMQTDGNTGKENLAITNPMHHAMSASTPRVASAQSTSAPISNTAPTPPPAAIPFISLSGLSTTNATKIVLSPDGQTLYLADGAGGLKLINITNPLLPSLINSAPSIFYANDVALNSAGTLAFVADGGVANQGFSGGLKIINVANPVSPSLIGQYNSSLGFDSFSLRITLNGANTLAYLSSGAGDLVEHWSALRIIDVSDPGLPRLLSTTYTNSYGVALSPNEQVLYIANGQSCLITANPSSLIPAPYCNTTTIPNANFTHVPVLSRDGSLIFIPAGAAGLQVVSTINPTNGVFSTAGNFPTTGTARQVVLSPNGNVAYLVAGTGAQALDISNLASIKSIGPISTGSDVYGIALSSDEKLIFVANGESGLNIFQARGMANLPVNHWNIITPAQGSYYASTFYKKNTVSVIDLSGSCSSPRPNCGASSISQALYVYSFLNHAPFSINLATLACYNTIDSGCGHYPPINLLSVSSDSNFAILSGGLVVDLSTQQQSVTGGLAGDIFNLANRNTVFLYAFSAQSGLQIINIANPASPSIIGHFNPIQYPYDAALNPNYPLIYVASAGKFQTISVTNPASPNVTSSIDIGSGGVNKLVLSTDSQLAYVGKTNGMFQVVNVDSMSVLTGINAGATINDISLDTNGQFAYLATANGFQIVNISNPNSISLVSSTPTGIETGIRISPDGNVAYLSGSGGAQLLDISSPRNPLLKYASSSPLINLGASYVSIPTISNDPLSKKAVLKVGVETTGNVYFFTGAGVPATPFFNSVSQISTSTWQTNRNALPSWFSFSQETHQFSAAAPKTLSGNRFILETQIGTSPNIDYVWTQFDVEPSLVINTFGKVSIESPSSLAVVTLQLANPEVGQFVLQPFGAVQASVNPTQGTLRALGAVADLNEMFSSLCFTFSSTQLRNTAVNIVVDDTVNIPQNTMVTLDAFNIVSTTTLTPSPSGIIPSQPTLNHNSTFSNQTVSANEFLYLIPYDTFKDQNNLPLSYSLTRADGSKLPDWLGFNPASLLLVGHNAPVSILGKSLPLKLTVSNGHQSNDVIWHLTIKDYAAPIFNPDSGFQNQTVNALENFLYPIPSYTFTDPNGLLLRYVLTPSSGEPLSSINWVNFNSNSLQFTAFAPLSMNGHAQGFVLTATNTYRNASMNWVLTIRNEQAPVVNQTLNNTNAYMNENFLYHIPSDAFSSNQTLTYSAHNIPIWLRLDPHEGIFSGEPTEYDLGQYAITVLATNYGGTANQTFTVYTKRTAFQEFLYLLKFIAPAVSGAGFLWTLKKNKALIRNTFVGEKYTKSGRAVFDSRGVYALSTAADVVKDVVVLKREELKSCPTRFAAKLTQPISYHLYGVVTWVPQKYATWVGYDADSNELRLNLDRLPQGHLEWAVQILDKSGYIMEEIILNYENLSESTPHRQFSVRDSELLTMSDRNSPRESLETGLLSDDH